MASFIAFVVLGVLVTNCVPCLAGVNIAGYVEVMNDLNRFETKEPSKEICETPGCVHAASSILKNMDPEVKPCDDFYRFVCGSFIKDSVIPDEKSKVDVFGGINDKLTQQLRTSLQDDIKQNDPRTFKLLQSYYKTCTNTTHIDKTSENDFRDVLKKLGGWPVLDGKSWNESSFEWKRLIYALRKLGYSFDYFVEFGVDIDMKNNSRRVVQFDQPSLGIPQEYLSKGLDEKVVQAYSKYMIDFAEIFGANREQAKKELADALDFEIKLAKISLSSEQRRNVTRLYNPMSIQELEAKFTSVPWTDYANELLAPHARLEYNETIIVAVPEYLKDFSSLLAKTPKRVLANYALWRVAAESANQLSERVQKAQSEFSASLTGTSFQEPRWKKCIGYAADDLYLATGALYVRRHFNESAKADAMDIIQNIRSSFENLLKEVNWMDETTRQAALEKLKWIMPYIAYPDEFLDDRKLDKYHQYLKINPESYLKTQLSVRLFKLAYSFDQLRKPVNKTDWVDHGYSAIVNAFYNPSDNSIQFPAGILQGEFFTNDRPKYLNYGAIGYVMGHEMTHGFDDQGRQFDKEGNFVEWWKPETKEKYLQRAQCIIDQYSNYTVKEVGLNINGRNTQGENIADNGGIKEAYFAYKNWERVNGLEPRLPGLNYTSEQMFWISGATVWCNKYRPEALRARVITDPHSPGEFRVLGPMSNMPEFSKDFNCPAGSTMNSSKKCAVW